VSLDSSSSTPATKRKKVTKILDSDSSSDEEFTKSSANKSDGSEQKSVWKIDRLKASLQKPASEPHDKQSAAELDLKKQSKDVQQKIVPDDERSKEKARKEEDRRDREKLDKKLSAVETVSKGSKTQAEDRSQMDASRKYSKHNEQSSHEPLEKGKRSDAKQRPGFVIPKVKKSTENTQISSSPIVDTWSDMLKRGAELEKNRPKQTPPNSAGMRRIPKIVPKDSLCGAADVGVLDKIEQHPGFLRWQQAASQKHPPRTEDRRNSVAAKSADDTRKNTAATKSRDDTRRNTAAAKSGDDLKPRQQAGPVLQMSSLVDSKPLQPPVPLAPEPLQPSSTVTAAQSSPLVPTPTKSLLPTPVKTQPMKTQPPAVKTQPPAVKTQPIPSLLSVPISAPKKALLPTPDNSRSSSTAAAPIPVLVRRGAESRSHRMMSSSPPNDEEQFVPDETDGQPG